jgi:hypothetical protein
LFTAGLLAVSIAFLTICQVYPANVRWLKVQQVDIPAVEINALIPSQSEWVTPPDVNFTWYPHLLEAGLKLTNIVRPWHWINRPAPNALLEAVLSTKPDPGFGSIRKIGYIDYLLRPGNQYAVIRTADRDIPCQAVAKDGNIDVSCSTNKDGKLIVNENRWSGWTAWRDGQPVPLLVGNFLTVDASAGSHTYSFRYWPWDVPLGLLISLLGIGMAFWLGLKRPASSMKQGANQD